MTFIGEVLEALLQLILDALTVALLALFIGTLQGLSGLAERER